MREGRKKGRESQYTQHKERGRLERKENNHRNQVQVENTGRKETATVETKAGITVTSFSCKMC